MVEDILHEGISGLTEAVITGPGWAILFYVRWSLGEGLSLGEAQEAVFILSGTLSWVGKNVLVNVHPLSLRVGRQSITQAITEWCTEARGPGCHCVKQLATPPFRFHHHARSPRGIGSRVPMSVSGGLGIPDRCHVPTIGWGMAKTIFSWRKIHWPSWFPKFLHCLIKDPKVMEVQCLLFVNILTFQQGLQTWLPSQTFPRAWGPYED